jgi:hypothetical protein
VEGSDVFVKRGINVGFKGKFVFKYLHFTHNFPRVLEKLKKNKDSES